MIELRDNTHAAGEKPCQFGLRGLFWAMTVLCVLLAVAVAIGPFASSLFGLLLCLVAAHVFGNVLGNRLRREAKDRQRDAAELPSMPVEAARRRAPSLLSTCDNVLGPLHRGMIAGAAPFGIVGGALLVDVTWEHLSLPAMLLGVASFCVIGTLAAFLAGSFWQVFRQAWNEALRAAPPDAPAGQP